MNQLYKKQHFIIIPVEKDFLIININKPFKSGHTHMWTFSIAKTAIDLILKKKLPRSRKLAKRMIRVADDKKYIEKLSEFINDNEDIDYKELMENEHVYKRHKGAISQIK